MSILIKGMEMPKNCRACPFEHIAISYCNVIKKSTSHYPSGKEILTPRHKDCPLVEIPPHGRLIDADVAAKQGWTISRTYSASPTEMVYEVKKMTDEVLPTIIEAEEGE